MNTLSAESLSICATGPFAAEDLAEYLPAFAKEIAEHGERAIVERCQIARANCVTAGFAVECVKAYFAAPNETRVFSEMARRAMTETERNVAHAEVRNLLLTFPKFVAPRVEVIGAA